MTASGISRRCGLVPALAMVVLSTSGNAKAVPKHGETPASFAAAGAPSEEDAPSETPPGLLPFYFESPKKRRAKKLASDIYGFSAGEPGSEKVLVWSVHTIVHAYPTFETWLASMKR
jgi:hypothetical protein